MPRVLRLHCIGDSAVLATMFYINQTGYHFILIPGERTAQGGVVSVVEGERCGCDWLLQQAILPNSPTLQICVAAG